MQHHELLHRALANKLTLSTHALLLLLLLLLLLVLLVLLVEVVVVGEVVVSTQHTCGGPRKRRVHRLGVLLRHR